MKRIFALMLAASLMLTACASDQAKNYSVNVTEEGAEEANSSDAENLQEKSVDNDESAGASLAEESEEQDLEEQEIADENLDLSDERLQTYLKDKIYLEAIESFDSDEYVIDNIETTYYSKEYIENLAYNSQENIYFGFTQAELDQQFAGKKYVFTLGDNDETTVTEVESYEDNTTEQLLKDVAVGTGVLLVCVTVSAATGGTAPAVSMIFALGAKAGTGAALSGAVIGGVTAGIAKGYQTGNFEDAVKAAAAGAGKGFKWGAITGALAGGASEGWGLYKATAGGLKMNEAALIQKESKYPLSLIGKFHSMEEYEVFKEAGLKTMMVNGKVALVQDIDLDYVDDATGLTNRQLMQKGNAPIDSGTGKAFELHHIGQKKDSPLAILNQDQHRGKGNFTKLHEYLKKMGGDTPAKLSGWKKQKEEFWMDMAKQLGGNL